MKKQDPTVSYRRFVQLLQFGCYSRSVLSGYVISVGGLQEFLSKVSKEALLEFIDGSEGDTIQKTNEREFKLSTDLIWILQNYQKCNRVIIPAMKVLNFLKYHTYGLVLHYFLFLFFYLKIL